jgi:hypothetical protein
MTINKKLIIITMTTFQLKWTPIEPITNHIKIDKT